MWAPLLLPLFDPNRKDEFRYASSLATLPVILPTWQIANVFLIGLPTLQKPSE